MTLMTDTAPATEAAPPADPVVDPAAGGAADPAKAADPAPEADAVAAKPAEESAKPAAETYDIKAPEGVDFDPEGLKAFEDFAKENGLSNEAANGLLGKLAPVMAERQQAAHTAMIEGWLSQSQTDKEFGGPKLQENLSVAKKAMDTFGTHELTKLLNDSGLGNHPEIIRAFYRAGKAISEDTFVGGSRAPASSADPAQRMYPTMN